MSKLRLVKSGYTKEILSCHGSTSAEYQVSLYMLFIITKKLYDLNFVFPLLVGIFDTINEMVTCYFLMIVKIH